MTIYEAIKIVLSETKNGLTATEIYSEIVNRSLYTFGAKNPINVVNSQIRRRCVGLSFPTAHRIKTFKIVDYRGRKPVYTLCTPTNSESDTYDDTLNQTLPDRLPEEEIGAVLAAHYSLLKQQILEYSRNHSPNFFEHDRHLQD